MDQPVTDYIASLPAPQQMLMERLHQLMMVHPGVTCRLRFGIPFYDRERWFVYLNPLKSGGVEVCFLHGRELPDQSGVLQHRGRKMVAGVTCATLKDLDEEGLLALVDLALIDAAARVKKRS